MERILKKKYYQIEFTLKSPLCIGSGENKITDKDIIRNSKGDPYIPASAIAGVIRDCLQDDEIKDIYLGYVRKNKLLNQETEQVSSRIVFYDATVTGEYNTSIRDSVALDEYKTAIDGAKFDMEVVETGAQFKTYIEQNYLQGDYDYAEKIVEAFCSSKFLLGGKSTRGYGEIEVDYVASKEFNLENIDDVKALLDFDLLEDNKWTISKKISSNAKFTIKLELKQEGGISIRRYTTNPSTDTIVAPDMEQMTLTDGKPVIPGTSWAGAFRHRMEEFGCDPAIFGYVKSNGEKNRSLIRFSESVIVNGQSKKMSRNAIDRFTGGVKKSALFTERSYYGGKTTLEISWYGDEPMKKRDIQALAASITDLHFGFLAIGGETGIGRGLFSISKINEILLDKDLEQDNVYSFVFDKVQEVMA